MDVRDVGVALWRQKPLILAVLLVGVTAVAGVLWLAPKTYEATASVTALKQTAVAAEPGALDAARRDLAARADGRTLLTAVAARLEGERDLDALAESVSARWLPGTAVVRVTVRDPDRAVAARTADAVAAELSATADDLLSVTVTDRAVSSRIFVSPPLGRVIGLGLGSTLLIAVGLALALARRTGTVHDAMDVESAAVAPLLAHLTAPADLTTMPALQPGSSDADSFRHLRLALEAETAGGPSKKVVVAGLTTGETDVWLGANAAIALASVGRRVLLVDARMGDRFGRPAQPEPDTLGLYDVLLGADLDRAVSPGPVELLSVLPSGTWAERIRDEVPDGLLEGAFDSVMHQAAERYDAVVVLAPPLDQADDARQMAVAGSLLLAVPEGGVSTSTLRSHATRVRAAGGRILGVVLIGRQPQHSAA